MTTRSNSGTGPDAAPVPAKPKAATYVKGSHAAAVRADHDERDDINEALRLLSDPGAPNVVPLTSAAQ